MHPAVKAATSKRGAAALTCRAMASTVACEKPSFSA
jgi:hypothetical protein